MTPTHYLLIAVVVALIFYTANARKWGLRSVSMVLRDSSWVFSLIPFNAGLLCGHWFFNHNGVFKFYGWGWALPIMGMLLIIDIVWIFVAKSKRVKWRYPGWYCLAGILTGALVWGLFSKGSPF